MARSQETIGLADENVDQELARQIEAYNGIDPKSLVQYLGQYVVSYNGKIVDSDANLTVLGRRFFGKHRDLTVYVTRAGEPVEVTIRRSHSRSRNLSACLSSCSMDPRASFQWTDLSGVTTLVRIPQREQTGKAPPIGAHPR
jgi:hypothetical protein